MSRKKVQMAGQVELETQRMLELGEEQVLVAGGQVAELLHLLRVQSMSMLSKAPVRTALLRDLLTLRGSRVAKGNPLLQCSPGSQSFLSCSGPAIPRPPRPAPPVPLLLPLLLPPSQPLALLQVNF